MHQPCIKGIKKSTNKYFLEQQYFHSPISRFDEYDDGWKSECLFISLCENGMIEK